jgi:3-dehydroquinate synthase
MAAKLPDLQTFLQAGIDPRTGLPLKFSNRRCLKDDIKKQLGFIIKACASLKSNVVTNDRLEGGLRKILNFGHTYAHAFETLTHYKGLSHGEAVAHGIKHASRLAMIKSLIDETYYKRIISLLEKYELTKKKIKFKKDEIVELMLHDKKVENSKINLLLPTGLAEVELFDNIDSLSIEASLL